jgi:PAS domain S-box-containing protein
LNWPIREAGVQTDEGLSRLRRAGEVVLIGAVYFVAAKLSLLLAIPPGYATPVWPPSGIALAAALLFGTRIWPGIWLGAALINVTIAGSPLLAIVIATGNTLEAIAAASVARSFFGRQLRRGAVPRRELLSLRGERSGEAASAVGHQDWRFQSGEDVLKFVACCALSACIAATVGVGALVLSNVLAGPAVVANAWTWWQGDASGMVIIAPLLLSWSTRVSWRWPPSKIIEAIGLSLSLGLAILLIFGGIATDGMSVSLAFLALPLVVWAAIRFSQREVMTVVAIVCAIAVWHAVKGRYPFGPESANASLLFLLAYTSTLVMTGLAISAVIGERERAMAQLRVANESLGLRVDDRTLEAETINRALREELAERDQREEILRQSEERFRLLVDGVKDYAIFMLDASGNVVSWNTGAQSIYGYAASEIIGTHFSRLYTPEDIEHQRPAYEIATARADGRYEEEGWRLRRDDSRFWASVITSALYDGDHRLRGFAKVTRDLTVPRRIEALQENERQMSEFLAMLSHELRNPLGSIVNALDLARHKPVAERTEARGIIERQVKHLAHIVDDLLDISRITRGKIELRKEILGVNDAVLHAVESCRSLLRARGHKVDVNPSEEELWIEADPTRLSQVILNLINNAAKYTPAGGHISISISRDNDLVVLRVRDTGIGIPPTLLPKVFDLFVQGDRSLDRTAGGLGIGLTIVKRMVEMHGGSVDAMSAGSGQGSEFVVRLPRASSEGVARTPQPTQSRGQASGLRRRLLIVDDNRDFANSLAALLEEFGHDVRTANDGQAAITVAAVHAPDAVLLDIGLPAMDGYEVARRLRGSSALNGVTLVAISGYGHEENRRRAREVGFDHYLVKPIDAAELINIIDRLPVRS